jgi:hypothetical protein
VSSPQQHDLNDGALMQNFREGIKKIQSQFSTTAQLDEEKHVRPFFAKLEQMGFKPKVQCVALCASDDGRSEPHLCQLRFKPFVPASGP